MHILDRRIDALENHVNGPGFLLIAAPWPSSNPQDLERFTSADIGGVRFTRCPDETAERFIARLKTDLLRLSTAGPTTKVIWLDMLDQKL